MAHGYQGLQTGYMIAGVQPMSGHGNVLLQTGYMQVGTWKLTVTDRLHAGWDMETATTHIGTWKQLQPTLGHGNVHVLLQTGYNPHWDMESTVTDGLQLTLGHGNLRFEIDEALGYSSRSVEGRQELIGNLHCLVFEYLSRGRNEVSNSLTGRTTSAGWAPQWCVCAKNIHM